MLKKLSLDYYKKMFEEKKLGRDDELRFVSYGKLKMITTNIDGNEPHQYRFTFLEQNPYKQSIYGKKARQGSKIMWIIVFNRLTRKERWLGRVEDGKWYPKQ